MVCTKRDSQDLSKCLREYLFLRSLGPHLFPIPPSPQPSPLLLTKMTTKEAIQKTATDAKAGLSKVLLFALKLLTHNALQTKNLTKLVFQAADAIGNKASEAKDSMKEAMHKSTEPSLTEQATTKLHEATKSS